jgi:hypothetical protein
LPKAKCNLLQLKDLKSKNRKQKLESKNGRHAETQQSREVLRRKCLSLSELWNPQQDGFQVSAHSAARHNRIRNCPLNDAE